MSINAASIKKKAKNVWPTSRKQTSIGFDKNDIVEISEKIGAFETSIQPFEDCCTIFVAKHPVTKPNVRAIERSEHHLVDVIDELLKTAIETRETILCE